MNQVVNQTKFKKIADLGEYGRINSEKQRTRKKR